MKRKAVLFAAALFLSTFAASAQTGTWTAVGSTGVADPNPFYLPWGPISETGAGFAPWGGSASGTVRLRYNVTNTYGGGLDDTPPWTTLEVGYSNTSLTGNVTARLYRVNRCSGTRSLLCSVSSNSSSSSGACSTCNFSSTSFNFATSLYYVEVDVVRSVGTSTPQVNTLRVF